jgi:hypothetical protein
VSVAASYAFQRTETTYQINGVCFYRFLAYALAVPLVHVCFSQYRKSVALAFSLALSAVAFSPIGLEAIELFPIVTSFLAILMGVTTILARPSSRGKGFFQFLIILVAPAILAESRIGGTIHLLATTESVGYSELSAITAIVVGGYFYLRYTALGNWRSRKLLSNGADEEDVADVSKQHNLILILIVVGASGTAASLMLTAPIVADALRATAAALPVNVLTLALSAGIALTMIFYMFQRRYRDLF